MARYFIATVQVILGLFEVVSEGGGSFVGRRYHNGIYQQTTIAKTEVGTVYGDFVEAKAACMVRAATPFADTAPELKE